MNILIPNWPEAGDVWFSPCNNGFKLVRQTIQNFPQVNIDTHLPFFLARDLISLVHDLVWTWITNHMNSKAEGGASCGDVTRPENVSEWGLEHKVGPILSLASVLSVLSLKHL